MNFLVAISDVYVLTSVQVIMGGIVTVALAWIKMSGDSHAQAAANREAQANEQRAKLAAVAKDTHTLVNSQHGETLRLNMVLSRREAARDPTEENIAASDLATRLYNEHEAKQEVVNLEHK